MREGTSGVWVSENDGKISIGYTDFGVSMFGGGDFEQTYTLDKDNSEKLISALKKKHSGSLYEMVVAEFGEGFRDYEFTDFCKSNGIEFSSSTWSG